jgi:hypothetical protein
MEFDRYRKDKISDPCGMHSTGYSELDKLPAKCAVITFKMKKSIIIELVFSV